MKTTLLLMLLTLVLSFFGALACAAEGPRLHTKTALTGSSATVEAVNSATRAEGRNLSLTDLLLDLLDSDVEYRFSESSSLVLVCNPFISEKEEEEIYHPTSNISVGLKFSF